MKRITLLISFGFLLITGCLVYLMVSGISLRIASLIKPSVMEPGMHNVSQALVLRMYPQFQNADVMVWGIQPWSREEEMFFQITRAEYERIFNLSVNIMTDKGRLTASDIEKCAKPCWIITDKQKSNELEGTPVEAKVPVPVDRVYYNMTVWPFEPVADVSQQCLKQKRVTFNCLKDLSIHGALKKMKPPHRYFFLNKYNERDFFLFLQETKN